MENKKCFEPPTSHGNFQYPQKKSPFSWLFSTFFNHPQSFSGNHPAIFRPSFSHVRLGELIQTSAAAGADLTPVLLGFFTSEI
jgi:hypothetical protein